MTSPWDPNGLEIGAQPCRAYPHPRPPGIRLVGELDLATHEVLRSALRALNREPGEVRLDMSEVTFIDSASVAEIARFARRRRPHRVVIESPSALLLRIVDTLFDLADFVVE